MNLNQTSVSRFEYEIKKSKFIALVYELKTKNDFENIPSLILFWKKVKNKYPEHAWNDFKIWGIFGLLTKMEA